ncbi:hypothetical protein B0O99DRAFT_636459 [Bisporella sp. PMI_857]|nr:hypothetical protein B0O99DRAFT_636459 [Bisporella sp. PMI_857]
MSSKRRRSSDERQPSEPLLKRVRTRDHLDFLSGLSDELLIRILHNLPLETLLLCQQISHRFYILAGDSQIWKNLYYDRFVLPRALRIPGIRMSHTDDVLRFSSRKSKWLDENSLVNRVDGKKTNWKRQYRLRHNWSNGACGIQEIRVADQSSIPSMLVKLAERVVVAADKERGLRAWDTKEKVLIATCGLDKDIVPTCLAIDDQDSVEKSLEISIGFLDGGWAIWSLDITKREFTQLYKHPASSNGRLSAVAFANPYVLTITEGQLLSLYTLKSKPPDHEAAELVKEYFVSQPKDTQQPHLLASLKSHTCWPPLSLSLRSTSTTLIASIAYSLPTYLSGYTVGLQELHLDLSTSTITLSRLASALPTGFHSLSPSSSSPSSGTSSPRTDLRNNEIDTTRPTNLSYAHPYILATHPDNTLTLYLCTSTTTSLSLSRGTKLWGHTSSISSADITARGKAVSVSGRGNEMRVWELEGASASSKRRRWDAERSVRVQQREKDDDHESDHAAEDGKKRWVGFDDEIVIVLAEKGDGQALVVYDFT